MSVKDRLERVAASVPIDGSAASVTAMSLTRYEPQPNEFCNGWFTECPPIMELPAHVALNPQWENLAEHKFGPNRVLGYGGAGTGKNKAARWVCLCACGRYFYAYTKRIRSYGGRNDGECSVCDNVRRVREGYPSRLASKYQAEMKARQEAKAQAGAA